MLTYKDLESAGYEVQKNGTILDKDGSVMPITMYGGKPTVKVYVGHLKEYRSKFNYVRVHRMVAEKFVENPEGFKFVAFKNGNPKQPRATNLMWTDLTVTRAQHATYASRRHGKLLIELGDIGWQEAVKKYGVNPTTAYNIWRKTHATINN
ncbi:HNH endonuclease [Pantoea phage Nifs112]|nr:HNH endonuclease [Pantoea phage Nifs112]